MLHAFNGDTGARRFSFVPSALLAKLGDRASPTYIHQYYMDGPIVLHDVYNSSSKSWRTILVASTGGGARSLFALDVTNPDSPTLLWEFAPSDNDMGYVYGEPVIARAADGTWVVVFGNGYGSQNNTSYLYVLNAFSGVQLKKLEVRDTTAATPTSAQGLSAPALLYLAGRQLGYGYVGDWQGNLWRIDMGGAPSTWTLGFGSKPLFKARTPSGAVQRITAKPRVVSDRVLGRVIVFGTGKLLEITDKSDTSIQSLYGIYDWPTGGTTASRSDLTQQTVLSETTTSRMTSSNALSASTKRGWYLDIATGGTGTGERIIAPVVAIPEISVILATTIKPTGDACDTSMTSAVMALSPFSGAANSLFDVASGRSNGVLIGGSVASPAVIRKGGKLTIMINRGKTGVEQLPVTKSWNPRAAWRQLQ
jgi:type IV pilus assembly protein PilY1